MERNTGPRPKAEKSALWGEGIGRPVTIRSLNGGTVTPSPGLNTELFRP